MSFSERKIGKSLLTVGAPLFRSELVSLPWEPDDIVKTAVLMVESFIEPELWKPTIYTELVDDWLIKKYGGGWRALVEVLDPEETLFLMDKFIESWYPVDATGKLEVKYVC